MPDLIFDRHDNGVALLTLNRPESLNAMGGNLMPELGEALRECEGDASVRVVAVTGAGRGFCAGGDIKGFARNAGPSERPAAAAGATGTSVESPRAPSAGFPTTWSGWQNRAAGLQRTMDRTTKQLHTMLKPTVAIVNGAAAGAGMSLALAPDIRLFSDRGKLVPAFGKIAFAGDFGGTYFLTKLVGFGRAREIYFLGEQVEAERALALGIANHVYPHDDLMDRALEYCGRIASGPPFAHSRMKHSFLAGDESIDAGFAAEAQNMSITGMSRDHREGIRAFMEKRTPEFTGE